MISDFVQQVNIGRQFYDNHLWKAAANVWNAAVVPPYLPKGTVSNDKLTEAREALAHGEATKAADIFKEAFQQIGSIVK